MCVSLSLSLCIQPVCTPRQTVMAALSFSLASSSSVSSSSISVSAYLRPHSPLRYLLFPPQRSFLCCCRPRPSTRLHLSTSSTPSSSPLHLAMASADTTQTSPSLQQENSSLPGLDSLSIIYIFTLFFSLFSAVASNKVVLVGCLG